MPEGVRPTLVRRFVLECPIAHPDALKNSLIADLIDEYTIDDFARHLAGAIPNCEAAEQLLGSAGDAVGALYELLTSFPIDPKTTKAGQILASSPFLRTPQGFVSPARGKLPGGFKDPIGYFEFLDTILFPPQMEQFAVNILSVSVLSFHEYIDDHLEEILARGPSREQYQELVGQIVEYRHELDDEGSLGLLAKRAFMKTRAGPFVRPDECYFWSAALEGLLGDDGLRWVDEDSIPPGRIGLRLRDLLESKLGMRTTVSTRHMVNKLEEIAIQGIPDDVAATATPIFRHIIEEWSNSRRRTWKS